MIFILDLYKNIPWIG